MVVDTEAGRILIVDDNKEHREALGRVLTQAGYHVVGLASSGEEALALIAGGQVELVISDMRMPRMGGLEFLRHVKRCRPTTQVIILTAYGDYVSYAEAVQNGAFQFLNKPVRRADILALARMAVRKARTLDSVCHGDAGKGGCPADTMQQT